MGCAPLAVAAQSPSPSDEEVVAAIERVFEQYKSALLAGDGEGAVALVDQQTHDYWSVLRDLAASGAEEKVRERSFIDRLLIVSIRHEIPADQLATMELQELIRVAFASGWIAPASIEQLVMGQVSVEGDTARAPAMTRASAADASTSSVVDTLDYEFVEEEGEWKFRFASLVVGLNRVIAELTAALGTEEDDLIFMLVESFSGRKVLPDVWQTPPGTESPPQQP